VFSQGHRAKVVEYLWLKYCWDSLSKKEWELFLLLPETLNSEMKVAALRAALILGITKVRENLIKVPFLLPEEKPTQIRYQGFKRLNVEIYDFTRTLPRVKKFSGYVKSASKIGSKRSKSPSFLGPLAVIGNDYADIKFDWYYYLTVGDQTT